MRPDGQPLQLAAPLASVPHTHAHVAGSRVWVEGQAWVRSQVHWHVAGSKTKPGAQVAEGWHVHAHVLGSHCSPAPQPPQSGRHSTSQVVWLQKKPGASGPALQSAAHSQLHVVAFQS